MPLKYGRGLRLYDSVRSRTAISETRSKTLQISCSSLLMVFMVMLARSTAKEDSWLTPTFQAMELEGTRTSMQRSHGPLETVTCWVRTAEEMKQILQTPQNFFVFDKHVDVFGGTCSDMHETVQISFEQPVLNICLSKQQTCPCRRVEPGALKQLYLFMSLTQKLCLLWTEFSYLTCLAEKLQMP